MNFMTFHSVGDFISPTDEVRFFRGVGIPPTRTVSDEFESNISPGPRCYDLGCNGSERQHGFYRGGRWIQW